MRRPVEALAVVVLLGFVGVVRHSRAQSTTTAPAPAPPLTQQTRSLGELPLEGRWLAVVTVGASGGVHRSSASLWDITKAAGGLSMSERHTILPDALRQNVEKPDWHPSPAELEAIAAAWDTMPSDPRGIARMEHEMFGRDGFTDDVKSEPMAAEALWVVRQSYTFAPGRARPVKEVRLLAARSEEPTGYRGEQLTVTVALAPVPIPIKIAGTFRLIRLPPPSRSFWSRVADVWRGCN